MLKALIFDFDGTIFDTETPEYHAWCDVYAQHNAELPALVWAQAVGTHFAFDPVAYLEECVGRPVDRAAIHAAHSDRCAIHLSQQTVRPGVLDLLTAARHQDIALAVASSSSHAHVQGFLNQLDLAHYFTAICTSDDVAIVKPDPALYLLALARLGVQAHEAVAIEDSPNGVLATQRAGISCLVIPNDLTQAFPFPAHGTRHPSLHGLDLAYCATLCAPLGDGPHP